MRYDIVGSRRTTRSEVDGDLILPVNMYVWLLGDLGHAS